MGQIHLLSCLKSYFAIFSIRKVDINIIFSYLGSYEEALTISFFLEILSPVDSVNLVDPIVFHIDSSGL